MSRPNCCIRSSPSRWPADRTSKFYDIPEEAKATVFPEVYPFQPCPALDDERFDLHEQKLFKFRDAQVIRHNGRNLIVSPFYSHSGGMVVDFMPPECATGGSQSCIQPVKT